MTVAKEIMRLAIYQGSGTLFEVSKNLDLMAQIAEEVARRGGEFLIFPELFLTGYNLGDEMRRLAEPWQGESLQTVASISREYKLTILVGYVETSEENFYNSVALTDAEGNLVANYRKIHLFGAEEQRLFTPGDSWILQTIAGFQVGIIICFDVEFPETVRTLAAKGAELIAVPTANMFPYTLISTLVVPTRALENQLFIAYANRVGVEGDLEYCGLSTVVAPNGKALILAGQEEALLFTELHRSAILQERLTYSYLDERRLDLYC